MGWELFLALFIFATPFISILIIKQIRKTKIEEKVRCLQAIDKNIKLSSWNLKEYIDKIQCKKFVQTGDINGKYYVEIDESHLSSSSDYAHLYFSNIKAVKASQGLDLRSLTYGLQLEVSMEQYNGNDKIEKITFSSKYLDNAYF